MVKVIEKTLEERANDEDFKKVLALARKLFPDFID